MATQLGLKATRIANAIVDVVERAEGAVTLRQIEKQVSGFCAREGGMYWDVHIKPVNLEDKRCVFWGGMSKAGSDALGNVIFGHRVAIRPVGYLNYMLEGDPLPDDNWAPIVLLPAKSANLYRPNCLMRVPEQLLVAEYMKPGWRVLTPQPVRCDGDFTPLFSKRAPAVEVQSAVVGQ